MTFSPHVHLYTLKEAGSNSPVSKHAGLKKKKKKSFFFGPYGRETLERQRFCTAFNTKRVGFFYTKPYFTMTRNDWTVAEI